MYSFTVSQMACLSTEHCEYKQMGWRLLELGPLRFHKWFAPDPCLVGRFQKSEGWPELSWYDVKFSFQFPSSTFSKRTPAGPQGLFPLTHHRVSLDCESMFTSFRKSCLFTSVDARLGYCTSLDSQLSHESSCSDHAFSLPYCKLNVNRHQVWLENMVYFPLQALLFTFSETISRTYTS